MMAPALFLSNFSPVGPAVMIALLGIITIYFVWWITRKWFGRFAAIISSLLYAISPTVITYSRSSWNPNIMPFFALLTIYSIWKIWQEREYKWLIITGFSMAFVLQSHYLGLLLVPVLGFFWLLTFLRDRKSKNSKGLIKYTLWLVAIFVTLMSPLVIFDARHGWRNFSAIKRFFLERQTTVSARPWTAIPKLPDITNDLITRLVAATNEIVGLWLGKIFLLILFIFITLMIYLILKGKRFKRTLNIYLPLIVWIGVGLIGLALYKQQIYDHYYGFFFPAPFILIGGLSKGLVNFNKLVGTSVVVILLSVLIFVNLQKNPLKYPPNRQLQRTVEVSEKIVEESKGREYNLAVIAERNYEGAYQYFLESWGSLFVAIDPQKSEETITDQLFVVCELSKDKCNPVNNPKAEVANFGWSEIDGEWSVAGVTLYKLIHTQ